MKKVLMRSLGRFEDEIAGMLLMVLIVLLTLQIVTRYVFNDPLAWTEEVSRHVFVWLVFVGASGAIRDRSHIAVEMFSAQLSPGKRLIVLLGSNVFVLFFLLNLFYWGVLAVGRMWDLSTATLEISIGLVYTVFPVTATLMIVRTIIQMREDIRAKGKIVPTQLSAGGIA
jgi:TRAP-type C4-dicarboxylate transport system permease small subunit